MMTMMMTTSTSRQGSLFDEPAPISFFDLLEEDDPTDPDGLRYYQREAFDAVQEGLEEHRAVLVVKATGLGKTQLFSALAKHREGRVLVLAHRSELVSQAAARLEQMSGELIGVEQNVFKSWRERIVVASVQSLNPKRIKRLQQGVPFSTIIVDEAHHYVAKSYRRPLDAWPSAKVIGVTATPDRSDKKALGRIFDSVVYEKHVDDGIKEGWLVPLKGAQVFLESIDLRHVKSSAGDLNRSQLDEEMCKAVEGIVKTTLERYPDRKGPAFFPGKQSAKLAAERFNALKPGCARVVTDDTPSDERTSIMRDVKEGRVQFLCNVMVATEGFDWPAADIVILGRPTKSRTVHTQMVGRGTRVLPGVLEHDGKDEAAERRRAIAASSKQDCIVLDFVGNSGKHKLVSLVDIFAGSFTDAERKKAKELEKESPEEEPDKLLARARNELSAIAKATRSKVESKVKEFSMLDFVGFDAETSSAYNATFGFTPPTEKQKKYLEGQGIDTKDMSKKDATKAVTKLMVRSRKGLATPKQLKALGKFGWQNQNISFATASAMLNYCSQKRWRDINPDALSRIASKKEEA